MVDPCVRRAAALSRKGSIGVVGTTGTVRSGAYEEGVRAAIPAARVRAIACPLLVSLAEEGWTDNAITRAVIAEYLSPFRAEPPDVLILGCTHYPVLKGRSASTWGRGPSSSTRGGGGRGSSTSCCRRRGRAGPAALEARSFS